MSDGPSLTYTITSPRGGGQHLVPADTPHKLLSLSPFLTLHLPLPKHHHHHHYHHHHHKHPYQTPVSITEHARPASCNISLFQLPTWARARARTLCHTHKPTHIHIDTHPLPHPRYSLFHRQGRMSVPAYSTGAVGREG